jgi:hypothetical protein
MRSDRDGAAMDKIDKVESTIGKGIIAGFVATFALSVLLDPIALFAPSIWPTSPPVGWVLHFFVGTVVWGIGFAVVHDYLPGPAWQRGLVFAFGAWLLVMIGAAGLIAAGALAIDLSATMIVATLIVHVLYGVALGLVYGWLIEGAADSPHDSHGKEPHPLAR